MKTAIVFPGQGAQFEGMGLDLYEQYDEAKELFLQADELLGFALSEIMFKGNAEDLRRTDVTQPALFVHSIIKLKTQGKDLRCDAVAGHSLGEFTALAANKVLSYEAALNLVYKRASAMQAACVVNPGTMAAILGLEDSIVEQICEETDDIVVAANYNCPGQLVISGSVSGIDKAIEKLTLAGAKRALKLEVGGAFHSPLMEPARVELANAINETTFNSPVCPVYQNINAKPQTDPEKIKQNLIAQLTGAVKWTQTIENMLADGFTHFTEVGGTGKVLSGLIKKVDRNAITESV